MNSQKVKALLRSIQNLKKELAKEKQLQKDSVRAQQIERLKKDIELQEIAINALRSVGPGEDQCDLAIKKALEKGPKRIRVASREELKMDIQKYKNIALKLIELLKANKINVPASLRVEAKAAIGVGLREEKKVTDPINADLASVGGNTLMDASMGGDSEALNEDARAIKERYESRMVELKTELNEQNEQLLKLIEEKEEQKIQIFAREQSIELQQKQIQTLLEKVRDLKKADNDQRQLINMKIALEDEVARLKKDLDSKDSMNQERDFEQGDLLERLQVANETIIDQAKKFKQLSNENGKKISQLDAMVKSKEQEI